MRCFSSKKKTPDLLMLISTNLSCYSAVQQSCTPSSTCSFIFFRRGEPCLFFNDRAFQNSNCLERRSFQRRRFWQMICKWLGIAYRDWCGNKMGWSWCFLISNLKFHNKYCQFHVQQPITSRMSSHLRAIWHHFYIILSTWLSKLYTG